VRDGGLNPVGANAPMRCYQQATGLSTTNMIFHPNVRLNDPGMGNEPSSNGSSAPASGPASKPALLALHAHRSNQQNELLLVESAAPRTRIPTPQRRTKGEKDLRAGTVYLVYPWG
jgi:hypothetical protein